MKTLALVIALAACTGANAESIPGVRPSVPKSDVNCSLVCTYAKRRFLSCPWSASRRLEAARIRGDEDEAKRMEAMLDDLIGKAIFDETEGPGK